jgi:hypothetical protein
MYKSMVKIYAKLLYSNTIRKIVSPIFDERVESTASAHTDLLPVAERGGAEGVVPLGEGAQEDGALVAAERQERLPRRPSRCQRAVAHVT